MSAINIADQLLLGSENTDLMKKRLEQVTSMMLGFAQKVANLSEICMRPMKEWSQPFPIVESHSSQWDVRIEHEKGLPQLKLRCHVLDVNVWILAYDTAHQTMKNHMVLALYEDREQFVEGMLVAFPKIRKLDRWQSLLNASNVEL